MQIQRAFTLIEMLIVLALLAILGRIAVPALQSLLERNQQQALSDQVARAVYNARAYAISQGVAVELCGSQDGLNCTDDWSHGWLLREINHTEPLLVTQLSSTGQTLHWSGFQPYISFHSNGISPTGNGRFYSCTHHSLSWQLILNRQGRLRTASHTENTRDSARCD